MKHAIAQPWPTVSAAAVSLLLCMGMVACGHKTVPPPPTPPPPASAPAPVVTLQATPTSIESGSSSTLEWTSSNAVRVQLNGSAVNLNGSQPVSPDQSTSYEVVATGADGQTATAAARVTVSAPPAPVAAPAPAASNEGTFQEQVSDAFFDFNMSNIRPDAQAVLSSDSAFFKSHPGFDIQIIGHADPRGTAEYNLALGSRRADSVKAYLESQGVDGTRLQTSTVGKEKPFCTEATEDCYQSDRRGHFIKGDANSGQ